MSRYLVLLLTLNIYLTLLSADRIRYDNYYLIQVNPKTEDHIQALRQLKHLSDSLKFFNAVTAVGKSVSILVAPHKQPEFVDILRYEGFEYKVMEKDFQRILDEEAIELRSRDIGYNWKSYHTLEETYNWMESLASKYPEKVELLIGGRSYEKRDILGVKVSFQDGNKGVFLEGGIHAREWIAPATVTYLLNEILTSNDTTIRQTVEQFDWYIFPHVNPDGYVYTHTTDRLWRKTRSKSNGWCVGVDANRNWDYYWNYVNTADLPCSDEYSGRSPFSEIETRSLAEFISSLSGKIHIFISFHSYSQFLMFPYGYTGVHAPNHDDLLRVGRTAANALSKRFGTEYVVGNVHDIIYPASGSSMDWAYGKQGIKFVFTYELRPTDSASNGFLLPAKEIVPTGQETMDSIIALLLETETRN